MRADVLACMDGQRRWIERRRDGAVKMTTIGVDVAQGGRAETVMAPLYGNRFEALIKRRGVDTTNGPAVAALGVEHMRDHCQVNIDLSGGWGGSARDHLQAQGIDVVGVVFGAGSNQRTREPDIAARWCPVSEVRDTSQHGLTRTSETKGH
jgi:hypothetical protein